MMAAKVAALLVVAAVLVATGASGAHASNVDFVNTCDIDAVIKIGDKVTGTLVNVGQTVGIDLTFLQGKIGPVYFTTGAVVYVLPPDVLRGILGSTGVLVRLDIICNSPECGPNRLAIRLYVQLILGGELQLKPITCLDVVIPAP